MNLKLLTFFLLIIFCASCGNYFTPNPPCPPPPSARPPIVQTYSCKSLTVPPIIPDPCIHLGLADLVDLALLNSPKTRSAWFKAKQAATDVGAARGAYLPPLMLQGTWLKQQFPQVNTGFDFLFREKIITATLSTSYLIFDFGGRNANLMAALWALDSLNWTFNWEIQTVMIHTIQSYYNYMNSEAILAVDRATVNDNQTTYEAAKGLSEAGVQSIADTLQAETALIQSQIILEQDEAIRNIALATLVQALGLPADTPICISPLPENIESDDICYDMSLLMQIAKAKRSDLRAMRGTVIGNYFKIRSAKSQLLPTLDTDLNVGRTLINDTRFRNSYLIQFNLNVPIFDAYADINSLRKAQALLMQSQADLDDEELMAFLAVASDYYELLASVKILKFSKAYVEVAKKNQEVAFAHYKGGINTIVEVMIANNAVNVARKQLADALTNFLTAIANLAYDSGSLCVEDIRCCPNS